MQTYVLDRLTVYGCDLGPLTEPGSRAIAAVYMDDDYDEIQSDSNRTKVGDTVTLCYVSQWEYYDMETGMAYQSEAEAEQHQYNWRPVTYRDENFTVAAIVAVPNTLSYRYLFSGKRHQGCDTLCL